MRGAALASCVSMAGLLVDLGSLLANYGGCPAVELVGVQVAVELAVGE